MRCTTALQCLLCVLMLLRTNAKVPEDIVRMAKDQFGGHRSLVKAANREEMFEWAKQTIVTKWRDVHRCKETVEMFSGLGRYTKQAEKRMMRSASFDKIDHVSEDITMLEGFLYIGWLAMQIIPFGILWLAPQCSTWLPWVSIATTQRPDENPQ